jgi:hypothetical protein
MTTLLSIQTVPFATVQCLTVGLSSQLFAFDGPNLSTPPKLSVKFEAWRDMNAVQTQCDGLYCNTQLFIVRSCDRTNNLLARCESRDEGLDSSNPDKHPDLPLSRPATLP